MGWFRTGRDMEGQALIYLSPEALKNVHVMQIGEFEEFQNSANFQPGGRLLEVTRQYGYVLRQVADLKEEPITFQKSEESKTKTPPAPAPEDYRQKRHYGRNEADMLTMGS